MTDVTERPVPVDLGGDGVTTEARNDSIALNGAVVVRTRRTGARRAAASRITAAADAAAPVVTTVITGGVGDPTGALATASMPLRERLEALHSATVAELERRRDGAGLEPADSLPVAVKDLSSITRDLPRAARELPHLAAGAAHALTEVSLTGAVRGAAAFLARRRELAGRLGQGEDYLDEFGFDREWTESLLPVFRWLYSKYWRVQVEGLENLPSEGRALLVSNHAGVLPYDGAMIRVAVFDEHPAHRHARALILNAFFGVPVASWFLRRTGNTLGHPGDAERLLQADELVLVFPEGAKGTGKNYRDRYRLRRFGRGGFVSVAVRTGAPIIPVSVVGSEEVHPMIANVVPIANALGLPYFPVTPTFPLLGPLGLVPLPSSWVIRFHEPIETSGYDPDRAEDAALVMKLSDQVRDTIQAGLYLDLERRGSVFA